MTDKLMTEDGSWGDKPPEEKAEDAAEAEENNVEQTDRENPEPEDGAAEKAPSKAKSKPAKQPKKKAKKPSKTVAGLNYVQIGVAVLLVLIIAAVAVYYFVVKPGAEKRQAEMTPEAQLMQGKQGGTNSSKPDANNEPATQKSNDAPAESDSNSLNGKSQLDAIEELFSKQAQQLNALQKQVNEMQMSGAGSGGVPGELSRAITQLSQGQNKLEGEIERLSRLSGEKIQAVQQQTSRLQAEIDSISSSVADIKTTQSRTEQAQQQTQARVTGSDIEIISVTDGFAFLRKVGNGEEFSLQVGESLRGYGEVQKITALGCIVAGSEKIEPVGGVCEL